MKEQSNSPLRILKSIIDPVERKLFLTLLSDTEFVAKDLEDSIELWLECNNDKEYTRLFYKVHDEIKKYFEEYPTITLTMTPVLKKTDKNGNVTIIQLNMETQEKCLFNDSVLMNACPGMSENIFYEFFPDAKLIIHEPNGRNECPDLKIIFYDDTYAYIEVKSVLCSFFDDGTFKGKVNNAMKGIDLILADMRLLSVKENKCNTSLRNITTVFFFYFVNSETNEAEYFKTFVLPAPLAIDCEFNDDGTFKKLGLKSDTNFNTVLNLKIRSPYNKYNTLADRALLIATGYTMTGKNHLISNEEGDFYFKMNQFECIKNVLTEALLSDTSVDDVLLIMNELKSTKYNTCRLALQKDKDYVKDTIKDFKNEIKKKFGKHVIR